MKKYSKEWILVIVFFILFILMAVLSPDRFLSMDNLQSMAFQLPEFGLLSLAMMTVLVAGGINLSITSTAALAGILSAYTLSNLNIMGINLFVSISAAVLVCLAASLACGLLNGFVVAYIGVSPILVTLGTMTLFEGISLNFTKGGAISGFPEQYSWLGNSTVLFLPVPMLIFVFLVILSLWFFEHTPWGMKVHMTGYNPTATLFSGINTKKVLMGVYLYSALLCGTAAIIMTSRYNSAKVDYGSSYLLQSLAAAVLGGTDISGGYGKIMGTVVAAAILQEVSSGLNILGLNRNIIDIFMGCILILVLTINHINTKGYFLRFREAAANKLHQ